jgi:DNA-binding MarR family transcriptional regulator
MVDLLQTRMMVSNEKVHYRLMVNENLYIRALLALTMDLISELAELALATRLKRLSERLAQDVNKIYKELNLNFESKWYLVLELLSRRKMMSIVDIADELKLTHPAIVQFVDQMLKAKLINAQKDSKDGRKRLVSLSTEGKKLLKDLAPVLAVIKTENVNWLKEADNDLLTLIAQLEKSLDRKNMYERIKEQL